MDKVVIKRFVYFKGNKYNLLYKIGKKKKLEIKDNETKVLDAFKNIEGVQSVSVISYQNDFGA